MDSRRFHKYYGLMNRRIMSGIAIPLYCVNRCCGEPNPWPSPHVSYWSSPRYCFEKWAKGQAPHPVCVRSAVMFNLKQLPYIPPRKQPKQLRLFEDL